MYAHLRANLWLLGLTIVITAVVYPAVLLGIGQAFPEMAQGSMVRDANGTIIGSRLIAQPFSEAKYFQPRPSAVSYNAAATGGTNWGASNPALRKRVMSQLPSLLKYRDGRAVGPDVEKWAREQLAADRKVLLRWQDEAPESATRWAGDATVADFLTKWGEQHAQEIAKERGADAASPTPADLAPLYFESYANGDAEKWPETDGSDLRGAFFEVWWNAHPDAEVEPVPSDLVMASGSGMDPHITRDAALYQLDRVAAAWASETKRDEAAVEKTIKQLIEDHARAPLGGLVGRPLVNVLELNLAVRDAMQTGSVAMSSSNQRDGE